MQQQSDALLDASISETAIFCWRSTAGTSPQVTFLSGLLETLQSRARSGDRTCRNV